MAVLKMILEESLNNQARKINQLFSVYEEHDEDVRARKIPYNPGFEQSCLMDIYANSLVYSELAKIQLKLFTDKKDSLDQTQRDTLTELIKQEEKRQADIKEHLKSRAERTHNASF